ncbi:hypothetical protein PM708P4_00016 [Parabacteroides phage PM708P4]|nr:hypothetical protein PM682P3_00026 [Parabacteroides phage PM682P3]WAX17923.1 hypothetical protein PM708P4_00016 [Parabacteroides phage PM708P4]
MKTRYLRTGRKYDPKGKSIIMFYSYDNFGWDYRYEPDLIYGEFVQGIYTYPGFRRAAFAGGYLNGKEYTFKAIYWIVNDGGSSRSLDIIRAEYEQVMSKAAEVGAEVIFIDRTNMSGAKVLEMFEGWGFHKYDDNVDLGCTKGLFKVL